MLPELKKCIPIGCKVRSKKTGVSKDDIGTIVGVFSAQYYKSRTRIQSSWAFWDLHFPGWEDGVVYFVQYKEPRKNMSFHEFVQQGGDFILRNFDHNKLYEEYSKLHEYTEIAYVEDDLELA